TPLMRGVQERREVLHRAVTGVDARVVGDIVAGVFERRRKEGQHPQTGDAQLLDIVEFLNQPAEIAYTVVVAVLERLYVQLVNDRVLIPERVGRAAGALHGAGSSGPSL